MLFGGSIFVGIDISDFSVEILSITPKKKVLAYERQILPEGIVVLGEIKDPAKLAEIIAGIFSKNKVWARKKLSASIIFPKIKTFVSHFELDAKGASAENIQDAVRKEALKLFPGALDGLIWDFAYVGGKDAQKQKILYAVSDRKIVKGYIEMLKMAGIRSFSIEIEPVAIKRALAPQRPPDSSCLVVDIGANSSAFYLFSADGEIEHASNIKIGGKALTDAIAKGKNIPLEEAERIKRENGLGDPICKKILTETFLPIEREIALFIEENEREGGEKLRRIILAGGGSLVPGLAGYLSERISREVIIGDPFLGVEKRGKGFPDDAPAVLFIGVIGAGLSDIPKEKAQKTIDFAPAEYKRKPPPNRSFIAIAVIIFLLLSALELFLLIRK